ncbi:three-helix bundle dimerization domain-containing protein [Nonomuraea turcica]|uniref:three-helix bundle dimerization domain-containing protein n=1 Tax=Nonomuraea sp. G32 TaxID=3067274 RepID=UPI00273CD2A4|nr:hypothetical protein [Nonomuraea sp. G32]MDP4510069.1 hypothetical protein [Nonomuraea sp. G32]
MTVTLSYQGDPDHERRSLELLRERLIAAYRDRHSPAHITTVVDHAVQRFAGRGSACSYRCCVSAWPERRCAPILPPSSLDRIRCQMIA